MLRRFTTQGYAVLQALASNRWFAYTSIALLQLKVVWDMWVFRDLPAGDTSYYFVYGAIFHNTFRDNIVWSPLYTIFYGAVLNLSHDAYLVTTAHRLIIIFVVSLLLLALMRKLLPQSIALLITAWWVTTPVNFDLLYEVHLFATIPLLIIFLLTFYKPARWMRGIVLALFAMFTVLVRNELIIATGLWLLICIVWEVQLARKQGGSSVVAYGKAYGLPLMGVFCVVLFLYVRAVNQFPDLSINLSHKHTLNVCQIYAYSYQQRYTDWQKSPWTECQDLMSRDFGLPQPSLFEAIQRNPKAMADYFVWNIWLIPDGVQVLLFNRTAGTGQPDYIPRIAGSKVALLLDMGLVIILIVGLWRIRSDQRWMDWIKQRVWTWLAFLCVMAAIITVMLVERPRPSYLLSLFFFVAAIVGLCLAAMIDHWIGLERFAPVVPILMMAMIIVIPPYFSPNYQNPDTSKTQPVYLRYERLVPFTALFNEPNARLMSLGWTDSLCNYITYINCKPLDYRDFLASKPANTSFADWLSQQKVTLFYVDENVYADPAAQALLADAVKSGWEVVTWTQTPTAHWELLHRSAATP